MWSEHIDTGKSNLTWDELVRGQAAVISGTWEVPGALCSLGQEHALWGSTARASPWARVSSVLRADVICPPHRYKVGENMLFPLMLWHLVALIKCLRCQGQGLAVPFCRWMSQPGSAEVFYFFSFLSRSLWNFFTNGTFSCEALRMTCPWTLWHLPWLCAAAAWEALPAHRQDLLLAKVTLLVREVIWKRGLSPF